MKKIMILVAAAFAFACGSNNSYVISGKLPEYEGSLYLYENEDKILDSVEVVKGEFTLKGEVEKPSLCVLADKMGGYYFYVILEPGQFTLEEDLNGNINFSGSAANEALTAYKKLQQDYTDEYHDPDTTEERRVEIEQEFDNLDKKMIEENTGNYFGVVLLKNSVYYYSGKELQETIAKFTPEMQALPEMQELQETADVLAKVDEGQHFVEITAPTAEDQEISLQSVVAANKYTLLDFWASWCGPCMGEVPHLKKTYAEYHDKGFEIYGYSFDKSKEKWTDAMATNEMNWIHVSTLTGFDNEAAKNYAVQAIPTNFLIDAEGTIVAKNLRGEDLYNKIAELLGE